MTGTREGGLIAAAKNTKGDPGFYKRIGAIGGKNSRGGGFATMTPCDCQAFDFDHHKGQCAAKKGGSVSRRGPSKKKRAATT